MRKKVILFFAMIIMFVTSICVLTGCEKGKDNKNVAPLVGSWEYQGGGYTYIFNEDLTGEYKFGNSSMKFTYEDKGEQVAIKYENTTSPNEFRYKIDNGVLIIKDSFDNDVRYYKK